jgi:hypothetical protein
LRATRVSTQCSHKKLDGSRCQAKPLPGKTACVFHDPELAAERAEGRRQGGVNRSTKAATLPTDTPDLPLTTVRDVITALATTFNAVRVGRMDARVGNCLGVLAGVLLKAIEGGDLEQRIAALESRSTPMRRSA